MASLTAEELKFIKDRLGLRQKLYVPEDVHSSKYGDVWRSIEQKTDLQFVRETPAGRFVFDLSEDVLRQVKRARNAFVANSTHERVAVDSDYSSIEEPIRDFMQDDVTWFTVDVLRSDYVVLGSDKHGSIATSVPGRADIREGERLLHVLSSRFQAFDWEMEMERARVRVVGRESNEPELMPLASDSVHERIAKRAFNSRTAGRTKTAGEIRFVKDRGPDLREIPSDFEFSQNYLKPLSRVMWGLSVAMGHLVTSHSKFTKLKAVNISPDGKLGGKGYIQSIKDMRRDISESIETVSEAIDTIHDEIRADHWEEGFAELPDDEREEVEDTVEEAEDIVSDPETYVEEEYDDDQD